MTRRILVVDDEADLRLLTSIALEDAGWEVATADGGEAALALLEDQRFDVILLDSMMPRMDGTATAGRVRTDRRLDGTPMIFLTAAARQMTPAMLEDAGVMAAIAKPFDVDTLASEVDAILARHASSSESASPAESAATPARVQQAWDAVRSGVEESSERIVAITARLESNLDELRRLAHSLAGKAPMVGLCAVGAAAADLESTLTDARWSAVRLAGDMLVRTIESADRSTATAPRLVSDSQASAHAATGSLVAVDDDEDLLLLIKGAFEEVGWQVRTATGEASLLALLDERIPDGITLDVDMPEMNGFELCERLRRRPELRDVPVLFLTSRSHPEDVARGLLLGSDDYLVKPIALPELVTRVTSRIERARLLLREAHTDSLTALPNRRSIEETFATLAGEHRRMQQPMSVAIIDLDHFKQVNDVHGHAAGDAVLRTIAAKLGTGMRRSDHCGRWGGEEFLLVFPLTTEEGALQIVDRLRREIAATPIEVAPGTSLTITFSAGVGSAIPEEATGNGLIETADQSLYEAKRRGRNQVVAAASRQQSEA